jgi:hypothetical protein
MVPPTLSKREHVLCKICKRARFFPACVCVCVCVCVCFHPKASAKSSLGEKTKAFHFFFISILLTRVVTAITSRVYLNTVFQLRPTRRSEEWRFGGSGDMGQLVYHYWTTTRVYLKTVPPPPPGALEAYNTNWLTLGSTSTSRGSWHGHVTDHVWVSLTISLSLSAISAVTMAW